MFRMSHLLKSLYLFTSLALFISNNTHAALVDNIEILPNSYQLHTIIDTTHNQQWQQGFNSWGATYNQVSTYLINDGYRRATAADLLNVFNEAGLGSELSIDQWGGIQGTYSRAEGSSFRDFLILMGFAQGIIYDDLYIYTTFDNGDTAGFPVTRLYLHAWPGDYYGEISTVFNLPNSFKDSIFPLNFGLMTFIVRDIQAVSVPEPSSLILAFIAMGLLAVRRIQKQ